MCVHDIHAHELLGVDAVGLVQHHADLLVVGPQRSNRPLEFVADVQLVRVKQQDNQVWAPQHGTERECVGVSECVCESV